MNVDENATLRLDDLKQGLPGLSPDAGGALREAAAVCLDSQGHKPGTLCEMKSLTESLAVLRLDWDGAVTDQMRSTWFDRREATESGAAGVAILTTLRFTDYTILRRMDIDEDTGMDYWLSKASADGALTENFLDGSARLEVAGRRTSIEVALETEVMAKLSRSRKSDYTGTPAYVVVVGFHKPVVYFETRMAGL